MQPRDHRKSYGARSILLFAYPITPSPGAVKVCSKTRSCALLPEILRIRSTSRLTRTESSKPVFSTSSTHSSCSDVRLAHNHRNGHRIIRSAATECRDCQSRPIKDGNVGNDGSASYCHSGSYPPVRLLYVLVESVNLVCKRILSMHQRALR